MPPLGPSNQRPFQRRPVLRVARPEEETRIRRFYDRFLESTQWDLGGRERKERVWEVFAISPPGLGVNTGGTLG